MKLMLSLGQAVFGIPRRFSSMAIYRIALEAC
jgi:hypothetical protein